MCDEIEKLTTEVNALIVEAKELLKHFDPVRAEQIYNEVEQRKINIIRLETGAKFPRKIRNCWLEN